MATQARGDEPGGIFLCYRRDDTRHLAGRIYDRLAERFGGARVFMDVDSIEPGLDFAAVIDSAVVACGVVLALIGPAWLTARDDRGGRRLDDPDDFVVLEIAAALNRGVRVLPVLVDSVAPPRVADLPEVLQPLARRQALRLDHETFRSDVDALLTAVAQILDGPKPRAPAPSRPTTGSDGGLAAFPPTMRPGSGLRAARPRVSADSSRGRTAADAGRARRSPPVAKDPTGGRTAAKPRSADTHPVYVAVMLGVMLLGLAWLVVNYVAGDKIGFMIALGGWNFLIGFVLIVVGLLMTFRWH